MNKFKVGDKVKVLNCGTISFGGKVGVVAKVEERHPITRENVLVELENVTHLHDGGLNDGKCNRWWFTENELELVQTTPKFELGQKVAYVYKFQAYIGIIVRINFELGANTSKETTYNIQTYGNIIHEDIKESYVYLYKEEETELPKPIKATEKLEKGQVVFQSNIEDVFRYFHFDLEERKEPMLPNKVIFNEEKKKVTLLFVDKKMKSKDGLRDVVTYKSYSSKASEKDHYHKEFGFYLSYYKYLNKDRDNKEFIDSIFNQKLIGAKLGYIKGAVHDIVKKRLTEISVFEDLVKEILKCEVEWDLRKHQEKLKLKKEREERIKERNEEINKREKEIERLRKQNDKETLEYLKANTPKDKLPFEV